MASLRRTLSFGGSTNVPRELRRRAARERSFTPATICFQSMQGRHFVRIFVIDRAFVAADVFKLGVSGFDRHERFGQRLEIAGILEPTVPYAPLYALLSRPKSVSFGCGVDVGGDLDTWCAGSLGVPDRRASSRVI